MSLSIEQRIKLTLGELMVQVASLQSTIETMREEANALRDAIVAKDAPTNAQGEPKGE